MDDLSVKVLCFNMGGTDTKNQLPYFNTLQPGLFDLVLLQEVRTLLFQQIFTEDTFERKFVKEAAAAGEKYICIIYKRNKFKFIEDHGHVLTNDHHRICLIELEYINGPRIIVASYHLPSKTSNKVNLVRSIFENLDQLRISKRCPVVIAGDFNCKLLEKRVDTSGFIVPHYNPTIHRLVCSGGRGDDVRIDFFAYKNCNDISGSCEKIKVSDVRAEMILLENQTTANFNPVTGENGQYYLEHTEYYEHKAVSKQSTLDTLHKSFDHDPLIATLTFTEFLPPVFKLLSCNLNNKSTEEVKKHFTNIEGDPKPDLLFLFDVHQDFLLKDILPGYKKSICSRSSIQLHSSNGLEAVRCDTQKEFNHLKSIQVFSWKIKFRTYTFVAVVVHKTGDTEINKLKDEVQAVFDILNTCKHSVLLVGDFNIEILETINKDRFNVLKYNPTLHRVMFDGMDNACIGFFAYCMNSSSNKKEPKICLYNVCAEMIDNCPIITKNSQYYVNKKQFSKMKTIHEILSPYDILKSNLIIEIVPLPINLLCFNMEDSNVDKVCEYFKKLNPKPDICMFQNIPNLSLVKSICGEDIAVTCSTINKKICIAYNGKIFHCTKYNIQERLMNKSAYNIVRCLLKCLKIAGMPEICITSFCVPSDLQKVGDYVKKYFEEPQIIADRDYPCPLLIAGNFNMELHINENLIGWRQKKFKVPKYNPSIYQLLHSHKKNDFNCFAYTNPTLTENSTAIELSNIYSEMIEPCPHLVTGPGNYNIDYDLGCNDFPKIHDAAAKHDPLRATMTVVQHTPSCDDNLDFPKLQRCIDNGDDDSVCDDDNNDYLDDDL